MIGVFLHQNPGEFMRKYFVLAAAIAIGASSAVVTPMAQAGQSSGGHTATCTGGYECMALRDNCQTFGGTWGGYMDYNTGRYWGICVYP